MEQISLRNFRCFREKQTARLAPLTLLVGENSTGKTSFMAMIRGIWDVAYGQGVPDFKEEPYDLGSFDEIAHYRGGRGGRADTFEVGFKVTPNANGNGRAVDANSQPYHFDAVFGKKGAVPYPVKVRLSDEDVWCELRLEDQSWHGLYGTSNGGQRSFDAFPHLYEGDFNPMFLFDYSSTRRQMTEVREAGIQSDVFQRSSPPDERARKHFDQLIETHRRVSRNYAGQRPYASAPLRSRPRRTYDPARCLPDSEGDYLPMYLASLYFRDRPNWTRLKNSLESVGQAAGLFDEISIKPLGRRESEPFQVQVRKYSGRLKGPKRNLIDAGYGVSQVLPVITEMLRPDAPPMFLLQQPEVHLHPSAQAALGSIFCQVAAPDRQLIIEMHSDHLLDRVRMDVRDGKTTLKPEDVSILYFERGNLNVYIHSIGLDELGNVLGAPPSYGSFFMEETRRSLGV